MVTASSHPSRGLFWGGVGVVAFSFTVICTRVAVQELDPLFVGAGRAVVAAVLAAIALAATRAPLPTRRQWTRLAIVAGGVVVGFPLFTSFALITAPASHGAVVIALLPAATAIAAVVRTGERPNALFWAASLLGAVVAVVFAMGGGTEAMGLEPADLLLFGAVVAAAAGYAEGGLLAREIGSWQAISWALIVASPVMVVLTAVAAGRQTPEADVTGWAAFGYLAVVSMFLASFAWYRGLAIGPMTRVSQLQLAQPALTIIWAALLLGEDLTTMNVLGCLAVIVCAAAAVMIRQRTTRADSSAGRRADESVREAVPVRQEDAISPR